MRSIPPPHSASWCSFGVALVAALLASLSAGGASARGYASPWLDFGVELEAGVQSARVLRADEPLFAAPSESAPRRGTAARDVHLPIFAAKLGSGCKGAWLEVGPLAWVCEDVVDLSSAPPIEPGRRVLPESPDGLPYRYFFVGPGGSAAYREIEAVDLTDPDMPLLPGFAVAITAERLLDGARYGLTANNLWVPMRDLGAVRALAFHGEELPAFAGDVIPVAWVLPDHAHVVSRPSASAQIAATKARFEVVPV